MTGLENPLVGQTNRMDASTLNDIDVPKWKWLVTTKRMGAFAIKINNGWNRYGEERI
jgi:hypothetical protein